MQNKMIFIGLIVWCFLYSCAVDKNEGVIVQANLESTFDTVTTNNEEPIKDSLYRLEINLDDNKVTIHPPKDVEFELPDSSANLYPNQFTDFNADQKEDVMVYMGACGSGGCVYGIFIREKADYYHLALMTYLKGPSFEKAPNGMVKILSYEEVEAYDPSKLYVTEHYLNSESLSYDKDSTYIFEQEYN